MAPVFDSGFNPVQFMYLNPIQSNIYTVEDAVAFYNTGNTSNLWTNFDHIPSGLDAKVYIAENKQTIDTSSLNSNIKYAMVANNSTEEEVEFNGKYMPTIYRSMINIDSNVFQLNNPGDIDVFTITSCNLQIGDHIKIIKNNGLDLFGTISNIDVNASIIYVDFNDGYVVNDQTSGFNYILYGIKVYDPLRLARINFLSAFSVTGSNPITYVDIDSNFNFELYQTLYPDTRNLEKGEAFTDYMNHIGNNIPRIGNVTQFNSFPNTNVNTLNVSHVLQIGSRQETSRVIWNNQELYYVTNDDTLLYSSNSRDYPGLITEYAIKSYLHNLFFPNASFCNITITGNFPVSNITVSNAICENVDTQTMNVTGSANFGGPVQGVNASFTGVIKSYKFGIGGSELDAFSDVVNPIYIGNSNTTNDVMLNVNGLIVATNLNNVSDAKLKTNIKNVEDGPQLPRVVSYRYHGSEKKHLGFLAHELEEMFPEAVIQGNDYTLKIDPPILCQVQSGKLVLGSNYNLELLDKIQVDSTTLYQVMDVDNEGQPSICFKGKKAVITGIVYKHVKMIDYNQVLMALVCQVKALSDRAPLFKTTNHRLPGSIHWSPLNRVGSLS